MSCRLKTYEISPPGGYPYEDTDGHKFASSPMIEDTARRVAAYRAKNNRPRSSVREALEDVDAYTCQRMGNMAQWCLCNDQAAGQVSFGPGSPIVDPTCKSCGAAV
jgi:hypothetical protein